MLKLKSKLKEMYGNVDVAAEKKKLADVANKWCKRLFGLGVAAWSTSEKDWMELVARVFNLSTVPVLHVSHAWLVAGTFIASFFCMVLAFLLNLKWKKKKTPASGPKKPGRKSTAP